MIFLGQTITLHHNNVILYFLGTIQRRCKGNDEWQELIYCVREETILLFNQVMICSLNLHISK